jgi:DedD protein
MPRSASDEEIELRKRARRRLVGAIVLVTVAVMILPMVLDQEPRPVTQDIAINIPPKGDAGSFAAKAVPAAEPARPAAVAPKPAPAAPQPAVRPAQAPGAQGEAERPKAEPVPPAPAPEKPGEPSARAARADAAAGEDAFVVQLDAFSNPNNAKQQQKRLADAGIRSYTETVRTRKGELTRVRVGPYASRGEAEQMRERLRRMGLSAVVAQK